MATGKINVSVDNIFPLIKKFLYSDHEIFLRELISNATDATLKLKHLSSIGEAKVEYGNPMIEIKVDKEGKKIYGGIKGISDDGSHSLDRYIQESNVASVSFQLIRGNLFSSKINEKKTKFSVVSIDYHSYTIK